MDVYRFVRMFIDVYGFLEDGMDMDMDGMIGGKLGDGFRLGDSVYLSIISTD